MQRWPTKKLLALPLLLAAPCAALAQATSTTAAEPQERQTLDKVEVTASKKKQLVLDVPYAVTAIGSADIRDRGVLDIKQLQSTVPSLFITENAPGQSRIQLRGMSTIAGLPTVGEYLDELSIDLDSIQRALDIPLVDMARVEVLRGPQGTLYGAGSLGGTIKFITRSPRLDAAEYSAEVGMRSVQNGQTGYYGNAVANLPLSTNVAAIRLVAGYEKLPGWVDNSVNGDKDINRGDRQYVRGKALLKINDKVDVSLLLYSYRLEQDNPTASRPDYTVPVFIKSPTTDNTNLANLVANFDLGFATLTSSSGYIDRRLDQRADITTFFRPLLPPVVLPLGAGLGLRSDIKFRVAVQELRLTSNEDKPFSYTAGVFYRNSQSSQVRTTPTTAPNPVRILDQQGTSPFDSEQKAVFGEVGYAVTPRISVTGGLRYFEEKQHLESTSATGSITSDAKFRSTSPRVNALWRYADNASAYVNVAKGFRSGGFNTNPPPTYGPETLWSYEVGAKGTLLGGGLQYDAAVYYSKYRDVQGLDVLPGAIFATTINTGKASGPGVDLALVLDLIPGVSIDAAIGYVDIRYDVTTSDRREGDPLNYIPRFTTSVGGTWRYQWPGINMPGMVRVDYQHTDPTRVIARSAGVDVRTSAADYVNLRVGVEQKHWQAYLEGRNLLNFQGITNPGLGIVPENVRPEPRSIGLTVRAQF